MNACVEQSTLYTLSKKLQSTQTMRLLALHQNENANEDASQIPSYFFNVGEGKQKLWEKERIRHPSSMKSLTNIL